MAAVNKLAVKQEIQESPVVVDSWEDTEQLERQMQLLTPPSRQGGEVPKDAQGDVPASSAKYDFDLTSRVHILLHLFASVGFQTRAAFTLLVCGSRFTICRVSPRPQICYHFQNIALRSECVRVVSLRSECMVDFTQLFKSHSMRRCLQVKLASLVYRVCSVTRFCGASMCLGHKQNLTRIIWIIENASCKLTATTFVLSVHAIMWERPCCFRTTQSDRSTPPLSFWNRKAFWMTGLALSAFVKLHGLRLCTRRSVCIYCAHLLQPFRNLQLNRSFEMYQAGQQKEPDRLQVAACLRLIGLRFKEYEIMFSAEIEWSFYGSSVMMPTDLFIFWVSVFSAAQDPDTRKILNTGSPAPTEPPMIDQLADPFFHDALTNHRNRLTGSPFPSQIQIFHPWSWLEMLTNRYRYPSHRD